MNGIIAKAFAKTAVQWHRIWVRLYTSQIETLLDAGESYASPKLFGLSGRCAAHGMKAVLIAKRDEVYKRGRIVNLPDRKGTDSIQADALER